MIHQVFPQIIMRLVIAIIASILFNAKSWAQETVVKGQVFGLPDSVEVLELTIDSYALLSTIRKEILPVDENGYFSFTLDISEPTRAFVSLGRVPTHEEFTITSPEGIDTAMRVATFDSRMVFFYLNPGDQQEVSVHADRISETLSFSGTGAHHSKFVNLDFVTFDRYKDRYLKNYYLNIAYEPAAFKKIVDDRVLEKLAFLENVQNEQALAEHLYETYRRDAINEAVTAKLYYPNRRKMYLDLDTLVLPNDYYEFMDAVDYQSHTAHQGLAYFYFLDAYLKKGHELLAPETTYHDFVAEKLDGRLRYEYLAFKLGSDFRQEIYGQFDQNNPYPDLVEAVKTRYAHLEGMLAGRPAPNLKMTRPKGRKTVKLRKFKGKYVYIDLWATWCGPCIQEIPSLQQLEKDYEGSNIVFLSLSLDKADDFEKWRKFLTDYPLSGHQYWLSAENNKMLTQHFNVKQIPRFILLDEELKVVDANAPRPSSPEIRKVFDRLLRN